MRNAFRIPLIVTELIIEQWEDDVAAVAAAGRRQLYIRGVDRSDECTCRIVSYSSVVSLGM